MKPKSTRCANTAVAAAIASLIAPHALGVIVNPKGLGQVLLFPYYTARTANGTALNTMWSVVNTTDQAKAVKVHFYEAKNGRMVLQFNLYLSAHDTWAANVAPSTGGGAQLTTFDTSCVTSIYPNFTFSNATYTGENADGAGTGLDRTLEGYFDVIEMGTYPTSSSVSAAVTHSGGAQPSCNFTDSAASSQINS